jgi:hypothetical protein
MQAQGSNLIILLRNLTENTQKWQNKVIEAWQDSMSLTRLVLWGQLRPLSSSPSTKRLGDYRRVAIEHYYGSHADLSKIRCMVTGEEVHHQQITAGHIYRRGWPPGLLVSILA